MAYTLPTDFADRPADIQRAIIEAEREAYANTIYQAQLRIEVQEHLRKALGRKGNEELIKSLTEQIEDAVAAIALLKGKLEQLPTKKEPAKAA